MPIQLFLLILCLSISPYVCLFAGYENYLKKVNDKSPIHRIQNIDYIYMINLDQRPEKLAKSFAQLHPFGIYPYRFSAINGWELSLEVLNEVGVKYEMWMRNDLWGTSYILKEGKLMAEHEIMHIPGKTYFFHTLARGTIGVVLSHLSVLKDAYDSGYETIWVMEDDIEILQDPRIIPSLIEKLDGVVGKENWDILFTDIDYRNSEGTYVPCTAYAPRPNFTPVDVSQLFIKEKISPDFFRIGVRYGAHSMIVRRSGIKKILDFYTRYSVFLAYDMDFSLPENIHLYSLTYDVVSQLINSITDNPEPFYLNKEI